MKDESPIRIRLVKVKLTGKRFQLLGESRGIVHCKGEVRRVNGFDTMNGPDRKFKRDYVDIVEDTLTEELLASLLAEAVDPLPEPRKAWAKQELDYTMHPSFVLTVHGRKRLEQAGYELAMDTRGIEEYAQDAAMDVAAYHSELTEDGVPEGYMSVLREVAADYVYDGILRALKEKGIEA
jgi:hypothetical protein